MHAFTARVSELVGRVTQRQREDRERLRTLEDAHSKLRREFDEMVRADEIAAAVLAAQKKDRREQWTFGRLAAGAVCGAILAVPALHDLANWLRL